MRDQEQNKIQDANENDFREIVIEAARKIFARFGFSKTTMDDISHAVRKGKSSLYYYFKSKEDIFKAVAEKEIQMMRDEMGAILAKANSAQEKIRAYIINRLRMFKRFLNLYNVLRDEYLENYAFIEKMRESYDQEEQRMISGILKEGVENGRFNIKDLDLTANAIIIALKGYEQSWAFEDNTEKIEENMDTLLDVMFYGIVTR